ncbi:MAG: hypothetical protein ACLGHC_03730 [Alphaproteobacteria bacterium]
MPQVDDPGPITVFRSSSPETGNDVTGFTSGLSREYLELRERAERAAAKRASSIAARRAHQQLALLYSDLVRRIDSAADGRCNHLSDTVTFSPMSAPAASVPET